METNYERQAVRTTVSSFTTAQNRKHCLGNLAYMDWYCPTRPSRVGYGPDRHWRHHLRWYHLADVCLEESTLIRSYGTTVAAPRSHEPSFFQ